MNRQAAEQRGRGAETLACWYLRLKGWRILARRARVHGGEVDIVARRGRMLAFVEVKARATEDAAAFALDEWRLRRVVVAAERLAPRYLRECGRVFGRARFHFDERKHSAAARDDVDFAAMHPRAAREDSPAFEAQIPAGERLGAAAALLGCLAIHLRESSSARA